MNYLACYKGPAEGLFNIIFHKVVCWWTKSKYSHCEIVYKGEAYSSSSRDGGVRKKLIDFNSGKWDLYTIEKLDGEFLITFYEETDECGYDYLGLFRFVLPFIKSSENRWFCSEWCAFVLKYEQPETYHIQSLVDRIKNANA